MKLAFLFVGQGVQKIGMGLSVYQNNLKAKEIFDLAISDVDIKGLCFNGPQDKLDDTRFTQRALLVTSLAIAQAAVSEGIIPIAAAGLSLGEYSALAFAKVFSLADALDIVLQRGEIMANALPAKTTGMIAVMGSEQKIIEEVCEIVTAQNHGICEIANINSPNQIVLTGDLAALAKATEYLKERNARRIIALNVSGAFHSSLLKDAAKQLVEKLHQKNINPPQIPVYFNVSGQKEVDIIKALGGQIRSTVLFMKMIETMIADGIDTFVEIGPGQVLSTFIKRIDPSVSVYAIDDMESLMKVKGELGC